MKLTSFHSTFSLMKITILNQYQKLALYKKQYTKYPPQGESATPAIGKINAENIPLPGYVDRETWIAYCRMRKAKRAEIKTQDTINRYLRDLEKLSGGDPDLARAILDQSIANTYTGLFALKSSPNRTVNSSASNDPFADSGTWSVGRKLNIAPSLIPEYLR